MSMFGTAKPTASLSSGLLARKGQAKPAMRPQGFVGYTPAPSDDLGWNDMGHDVDAAPVAAPVPPVLIERESLAAEFQPSPVAAEVEFIPAPEPVAAIPATPSVPTRPVSVATAARLQRETSARNHKAAFTLRLDAERHLRLRLASAIQNLSAQALVTAALDAFFNSVPEIEALASQLPARDRR